MKSPNHVTPMIVSVIVILSILPHNVAASASPAEIIPSNVLVYVSYADTEGRAANSGTCSDCFPSPWCGSPGVQFIGASTNYNGNSTDPNNCTGGGWDTGGIMITNGGSSAVTFTNLTVTLPLPSSGGSIIPTCVAEERPITFNVWFGHQYYWNNPADPAFYGGMITVPAGGEAIFAGTSSANSYQCPTGNYPSIGLRNGTYDFDSSDAYYLNGCTPTTDPSSAPRITFSAVGFAATTYTDNGHTIDTGGIDPGNCDPTAVDPQLGHEYLGWRLVQMTCGESCPSNQVDILYSHTPTYSSTTSNPPGLGTTLALGAAVTTLVFVVAAGYVLVRRRKSGPSRKTQG